MIPAHIAVGSNTKKEAYSTKDDFEQLRKQTAEKLEQAQIRKDSRPTQPRVVHHLDADTTHRIKRGNEQEQGPFSGVTKVTQSQLFA